MAAIEIKCNPEPDELQKLGVFDWPIWEKEPSTFPWTYDETETCYFLEGKVTVTTNSGNSVTVTKGDLVTFPKGLECTWEIHEAVRKHYRFG